MSDWTKDQKSLNEYVDMNHTDEDRREARMWKVRKVFISLFWICIAILLVGLGSLLAVMAAFGG